MKFNLTHNLLSLIMFFCASGLIGCSSTARTTANTEPNKTTANVEKTVSEKGDKYPATTNRDTGTEIKKVNDNTEKIGVAECDAYLEKYEACLAGKVPEASRQQLKSSLDLTRHSWQQLAANPTTKATLAAACKQSEAAAKQALTAYQCDF